MLIWLKIGDYSGRYPAGPLLCVGVTMPLALKDFISSTYCQLSKLCPPRPASKDPLTLEAARKEMPGHRAQLRNPVSFVFAAVRR